MPVARVADINSSSPQSFDAAIRDGIDRAHMTLKNVKSAWIKEQSVSCENGKVTTFRVNMRVTFVLDD